MKYIILTFRRQNIKNELSGLNLNPNQQEKKEIDFILLVSYEIVYNASVSTIVKLEYNLKIW